MKLDRKIIWTAVASEARHRFGLRGRPWSASKAPSPPRFAGAVQNSAFTLIEMILAVGVAAIVLIAVNAVFFSALRVREAATNAVDEATPVEQAFATIRRDLQCAVTPNPNAVMSLCGDFKAGNVTTLGLADNVNAEMFTATGALSSDADAPWGDIQRVTYGLKKSATSSAVGKDLIRTVTRNLLSGTTPDAEEQWMLGGVESVQFLCFDGAQWFEEWDTTSTSSVNTNLPTAVRVRIQMSARNGGGALLQPIEMLVPIDSQSRTNT
jgi:type II secretion system protein J